MLCRTCGKQLADTAKFCGSCGTPVLTTPSTTVTDTDPAPSAVPPTPSEPAPAPDLKPEAGPVPPALAGSSPPTAVSTNYTGATTRSDPFVSLLLAGGGLALIVQGPDLAYAFVDDFSSAKAMVVLLLVIGLASAGVGAALSAPRARSQIASDAAVTASTVAFALGAFAVAYGVLRVLTAFGQ